MGDTAKTREPLWDVLRGFAIILVVFAHCIQNGSGAEYSENALYFGNRVYQFRYSFHMPLFMLVSGYLCYESMQRADAAGERKRLLVTRMRTFILPIFSWTAIDYARILILNHIYGQPQPEAIVFVYFYNALNNLWFLWAVWWSFIVVYVVHYIFHDNVCIYAIIFLLFFVFPDGLNMGAYKYMLPYFTTAFYGHNMFKKLTWELGVKKHILLTVLLGFCFLALFCFYNEESFIYLTGYKLIGRGSINAVLRQLATDIYRMAVGFAGSLFFIMLWRMILQKVNVRLLMLVGRNSLGIYILSGYLIVFGVQRLTFAGSQSYGINFLEAMAVLLSSLALSELMGKIPLLKTLVGKHG